MINEGKGDKEGGIMSIGGGSNGREGKDSGIYRRNFPRSETAADPQTECGGRGHYRASSRAVNRESRTGMRKPVLFTRNCAFPFRIRE